MDMEFFFELYGDLPKQGPGSDESTMRALRAIPDYKKLESILDVGCGTGRHTILLAKNTFARITALEFYDQQIAMLRKNVELAGLSGRIGIVKRSMDDLSFSESKYDLIWSESSIYNIGFEKGLRYWRDYVRDGGFVAVSELAWLTDDPAREVLDYWNEQYPGIGTLDEKMEIIRKCDYDLITHFTLPDSDWLDGYYEVLLRRVGEYDRGDIGEEAANLLSETEIEMDMFKKYSDQCGYAFFVMRKKS